MKKILLPLVFIFLIFGCKKNVVFEKYYKFGDNLWNETDTAVFTVPSFNDTAFYDIYFNIRHTTTYPYKNLWLFVQITNPQGVKEIDTVNIFLADDKGFWLGEGLGDIWDYKYPFKQNVGFVGQGNYVFKIVQGMRDVNNVPIMEIGLIIEKSKPNGKK